MRGTITGTVTSGRRQGDRVARGSAQPGSAALVHRVHEQGSVQDSAGPAGSVRDHGERAGLRLPQRVRATAARRHADRGFLSRQVARRPASGRDYRKHGWCGRRRNGRRGQRQTRHPSKDSVLQYPRGDLSARARPRFGQGELHGLPRRRPDDVSLHAGAVPDRHREDDGNRPGHLPERAGARPYAAQHEGKAVHGGVSGRQLRPGDAGQAPPRGAARRG